MKLNALITQYVTFRQSMGEHFDSIESLLNTFCRQMGQTIEVEEVETAQVNAFLNGTGPVTRYWHRKYSALCGLYRYALSRGLVTVSPLPATVPKLPPCFVPYIYSHDEIHRLLHATDVYRSPRKLQPYTLRAILLLLYGAGLRISEAVALTLEDVDLANALITIRNTKFDKTRLVPLGTDLNQAMGQYLIQRNATGHAQHPQAPFFVLRRGGRVSIQIVESNFRCLCEYTGIQRTDGARYQPRLHDFRHSFAVHRLTAWYQQGADVQTLLPQLSTYLGHTKIAATQVYLTMTPALLQQALQRFERYAFAEVDDD